jgi:ferredoxin-type protein NapH
MAKRKSTSLSARLARWRTWVQGAFLLVWLDPLMLRLHNVCGPVFHCYSCPLATFACPIGVLANFSALHVFPYMAIGTLLLVGSLLGSLICGWVCPFGFLQDLIGKVPTPRFRLPGWTGYFRYVVLVSTVLAIPWFLGESHPLFVCRLCPAGALEGAVPNMVTQTVLGQRVDWPSVAKLTILVLIVAAMFFTSRPWCRLFCPLGAIYGLFNRFSVFFLGKDPALCKDCRLCRGRCRYGLAPDAQADKSYCIRCLDCTDCEALTLGSIFTRRRDQVADSAGT